MSLTELGIGGKIPHIFSVLDQPKAFYFQIDKTKKFAEIPKSTFEGSANTAHYVCHVQFLTDWNEDT